VVAATLVTAASFGVIFVAASGAAPPTCPTPGNFEIDGNILQQTCTPGADDWNTPNIGVQSTTQGGTYKTAGKDDSDPSSWQSSGATPDKTDFAKAYATSRVVNGDFYVFVAWERTSTSGTQGYAIEIPNAGANVGADGTPQPKRGSGGSVFYISSQGSSAPQFNNACSYTTQSDYGTTCTTNSQLAGVSMAINTAQISDPLSNTTQPAGGFFEVALDITTLTGIKPSCPGPAAASVYLRSITGQTANGNLKGYMAPLSVSPDSTCVPPPITTTAKPGGSTAAIGSSQHDEVTVSDGTSVGVGSVKFFLCSPAEVTANGGDCKANGTQIGLATTLSNGQASSDSIDGTTTPNDNTLGKYCWRAEFTPDSGDHHFLAGSHTNSDTECFTVVKNSPAIVTTPNPTSVTLGTASVTLKDSAGLSGGHSPTGTVTFTLVYNGSTLDTETVSVSGNGTYATSTGYTLPTLGTVTGTYQWNATYSGDSNNNSVSENNDVSERVTVTKASPTVVTTASPHGTVTLDNTGSPTLNDSAVLSGGYHPSGTITFTLKYKGSTVDTETASVSGNGTYSTPTGYTVPSSGTVTGSYVWTATYGGDGNNNSASDPGTSALEQVAVDKASPSIVTTPDPMSATLGNGTVTLNDSALLSGGYHPTGTITFTLVYKGATVDTETAAVSGDGSYSTPTGFTLPSSGTVTGAYQWNATYNGDGNNNVVSENDDVSEQVTINPANPAISTTPSETAGSVNDVLNDTAHLSGGTRFDGSGTITFKLYGPSAPTCSGTAAYTETVTADHDGEYTTSNSSVEADTAGTWNWTATFSGDSNNSQAVSGCGAESVAIGGAAIHILKTADAARVSAGDPIGFTMTVWNSGNGDAKGVTLTDTLPTNPGLDWKVAGQGSGWSSACSINSGVLTCGPDKVPARTTKDASTFTVHITSVTDKTTAGDCRETAGVVDNTGDVSTANDGSDSSNASICVAAPVIHILKTADAARVSAGDPIGFTMTVWNSGNGDAKGVTLTDTLPTNPGLDWKVAGQGSGWSSACSINSGVLTCGPDKAPAGTTKDASTFTVHITSVTTGATGGDCPETGVVDNTGGVTTSNDGTDASSASTCVQAMVDLSVTKSGSPAEQTLGQGSITWTMVVTNNGPSADTGVVVSDPLPAGNTYVSSSTTQGTCTGGAILNCAIGNMAADQSVTITLITTPTAAGTQTNTVNVVGDRPETNTANNTATATVQVKGFTPPKPCIAVSRVTPKQLFVGRKTTLTIHLTQGGRAVKGIHVRIKGAKINVRTKASNSKGVVKHTLKMKRAGILVFTPIAGKACNTDRVGVTNVFTPPVTG
jgi:uncharacterized repeat protein (TIGR01451 family)